MVNAQQGRLDRVTGLDSAGRVLFTRSLSKDASHWLAPRASRDNAWVVELEQGFEHRMMLEQKIAFATPVTPPPRKFYEYFPKNDSVGRLLFEIALPAMYARPSPMHIQPDRDAPPRRVQTELQSALFSGGRAVGFDQRVRVFVTDAERYRIDVFEPGNRHVRSISREHTLIPIADNDVRRFIELGSSGRVLVSPEGSFWVFRSDAYDPAGYPHAVNGSGGDLQTRLRMDLFDAEGRFLGTTELPPRFRPIIVRGMRVTGVMRDELNVPYVVTFEVEIEPSRP